ncbi:MAG: peptidase S10 [Acidobacteria bacterium]|nr:MAG: peptidase S10 [Acidobacteriota bacterium]
MLAQEPGRERRREAAPPSPAESQAGAAETKPPAKPEEKILQAPEGPVVTHHQITVEGKTLKFTATAGTLPIRNADGEAEAHIFFIAYTLDNPESKRPLMFSFNGGPGSASVWLHLGAIGPRRVKLLPEGGMPKPPFELEDNPYTWLAQTDLTFIDPVGTGYSRPEKKELGKKFWGVNGDIESVGEFIRLYLTRNDRWNSPLFLVGESYGTTRAAGLSGYLVNQGVALDGIILVSTVLNFETLEFTRGNDLPYVLYLPSYTATAWFHKKLAAELQQQGLEKTLDEARRWAGTDYSAALAKGDALPAEVRRDVAEHLARYTGLSPQYIENANLRVEAGEFRKELLRNEKRTVGRLDSRFEGIDVSGISQRPDYDPSEAAIRPPFTSAFNNYVRTELGYKADLPYYVLGGGIQGWEWGSAAGGFPDVSPSLRSAIVKNPYMHLFVASGHFDLATPFFATEYTLDHLGLDPELRARISTGEYDAGHMMYINNESLSKLHHDVAGFLEGALRP